MIDAERWNGWGWDHSYTWPPHLEPGFRFDWEMDPGEAEHTDNNWMFYTGWPDAIAYADAGTEAV